MARGRLMIGELELGSWWRWGLVRSEMREGG